DPERRLAMRRQSDADERVARLTEGREQVLVQRAVRENASASTASNGQQDAALAVNPSPDGLSLGDASEGADEVLVVLERHDAIQGPPGQRGGAAGVVRFLAILSPQRVGGVDHLADAERACQEQGELSSLDVAARADALAVNRLHLVGGGG